MPDMPADLSKYEEGNKQDVIFESQTHLVTTFIFTPKTPDCFRDGIRFRLNSLLVNFMESFTSIWHTSRTPGEAADQHQDNATQANMTACFTQRFSFSFI